jgi:hypothetical protein
MLRTSDRRCKLHPADGMAPDREQARRRPDIQRDLRALDRADDLLSEMANVARCLRRT